MPITRSALKKLRRDRRRQAINARVRRLTAAAVKAMRRQPSPENLAVVSSRLARAAQAHVIHPNKAARLTSRLERLAGPPR